MILAKFIYGLDTLFPRQEKVRYEQIGSAVLNDLNGLVAVTRFQNFVIPVFEKRRMTIRMGVSSSAIRIFSCFGVFPTSLAGDENPLLPVKWNLCNTTLVSSQKSRSDVVWAKTSTTIFKISFGLKGFFMVPMISRPSVESRISVTWICPSPRYRDDANFGVPLPHLEDRLDIFHHGYDDVHDDTIRLLLGNTGDCGETVVRFNDVITLGFQCHVENVADRGLIVHYENLCHNRESEPPCTIAAARRDRVASRDP